MLTMFLLSIFVPHYLQYLPCQRFFAMLIMNSDLTDVLDIATCIRRYLVSCHMWQVFCCYLTSTVNQMECRLIVLVVQLTFESIIYASRSSAVNLCDVVYPLYIVVQKFRCFLNNQFKRCVILSQTDYSFFWWCLLTTAYNNLCSCNSSHSICEKWLTFSESLLPFVYQYFAYTLNIAFCAYHTAASLIVVRRHLPTLPVCQLLVPGRSVMQNSSFLPWWSRPALVIAPAHGGWPG